MDATDTQPTAIVRKSPDAGSATAAARARWRVQLQGNKALARVVDLSLNMDEIYLGGRHAAMADDPLSLVMSVQSELEGRLGMLHRLCAQVRSERVAGSVDDSSHDAFHELLKSDLDRLRTLVEGGLGAAMQAGRRLEQERDAALRTVQRARQTMAALANRCDLQEMTIADLRQRITELERQTSRDGRYDAA